MSYLDIFPISSLPFFSLSESLIWLQPLPPLVDFYDSHPSLSNNEEVKLSPQNQKKKEEYARTQTDESLQISILFQERIALH